MQRRLIIVVLAACALLALLVGFNLFKQHMVQQIRNKNAAPPQTVSATKAEYSDWQPEINAVGSLRAVRGVDVTTEVTGLVRTLRFKSGDEATSGQVLVELNADADIAQQRALEAAAELASTVYERDKVQYEAQAISKAQLDADAADLKNKRAQVAAQAALVAKKFLRAPFAGRLGITTVNPGQYLNTGDKVVTLQQVDPIYVDFRLPQQQLALLATGQKVNLTTDAYPGVVFTGTINAIDPRVDTSTRNVQAEATIANPDRKLVPGMFGRVAVIAGEVKRYLTLPQTAVTYNPYGATVFLARSKEAGAGEGASQEGAEKAVAAQTTAAKQNGSAHAAAPQLVAQQSFVKLGPTRGDQVAIVSGISEGDLVVTSGQLKLINGAPLIVDNTVIPANDPHPTPQEH
ncbi:MAG TPA: efflux RND transporter periplasmic adaptor subunit [Steroidobacteraceae bacterium]|nr:efflux RND transporter periplasmic adaptor subunit [Steroidobacteraceae bacterium]